MRYILIGAMLSVCLSGCSSSETKTTDILIVDGCAIEIKGISSVTADHISKNWKVGKDCQINQSTDYTKQ